MLPATVSGSRLRVVSQLPAERVDVLELGDLVDVAIDSRKRVIYDSERERYTVLDGSTAYIYAPAEQSFPPADDGDEEVTHD